MTAGRTMHRDVKGFLPIRGETASVIRRAPDASGRPVIWIDLENTPHVPFFMPVIRELRRRGLTVVVTARDAYQTCELAAYRGLDHSRIGRHWGRHKAAKVLGLLWRGGQLAWFALRLGPGLALHFGSRSQALAARCLGIPTVEIMDYEHTAEWGWLRADWLLMPEVVRAERAAARPGQQVFAYHGIKEDVYVSDFRPDPMLPGRLGLGEGHVVVTVRPPATEAHYHQPDSERLMEDLMERLLAEDRLVVVLLPRNARQEHALRSGHPGWFADARVKVPSGVVDGLSLLWFSDLVVSGGGTMMREAVALGVPSYSIFRGTLGAVDRWLASDGRLVLIESPEQIARIPLVPRQRGEIRADGHRDVFNEVLGHVLRMVDAVAANRGHAPRAGAEQ